MFESIMKFFKKRNKGEKISSGNSKDAAKERLHLVLMQDRANVSADFLELMKQEIIEVIKKYIDIDESAIDVRLTNKENEDGTNGAPALYANIPIMNIKNEARKIESKHEDTVKEEINSKKSVNHKESDNKSESKEEKNSNEIKVEKDDKNEENKKDKDEEEKIKEQQELKENNEKQDEKQDEEQTENKEEKSEKLEETEKIETTENSKAEN